VHDTRSLGLSEARSAVNAVLAIAEQDPSHPIVVAVVDAQGELVFFARMDGARHLPRSLAVRKAYTAARTGSDSGAYGERMSGVVQSLQELDPMLTGLPGGVCVKDEGTVVGGIGVSGRSADDDEVLAKAGREAMTT